MMIGRMFEGACAVALIIAAAVFAEPAARSDPSADANRKICRSFADTGSRLGRYRACHTEQEWSELRRQTKQNVDHIQNWRVWNSLCTKPSGTGC